MGIELKIFLGYILRCPKNGKSNEDWRYFSLKMDGSKIQSY